MQESIDLYSKKETPSILKDLNQVSSAAIIHSQSSDLNIHLKYAMMFEETIETPCTRGLPREKGTFLNILDASAQLIAIMEKMMLPMMCLSQWVNPIVFPKFLGLLIVLLSMMELKYPMLLPLEMTLIWKVIKPTLRVRMNELQAFKGPVPSGIRTTKRNKKIHG